LIQVAFGEGYDEENKDKFFIDKPYWVIKVGCGDSDPATKDCGSILYQMHFSRYSTELEVEYDTNLDGIWDGTTTRPIHFFTKEDKSVMNPVEGHVGLRLVQNPTVDESCTDYTLVVDGVILTTKDAFPYPE
jgi:hypothetical protein